MRTTTPAPLARVAALLTLLLVPAALAQRVTDPDAGNQPRRLESPNLDRIFELNPADAPIESDARVIDSYNKHGFEWSFNVSNPSKDYGPGGVFYLRIKAGVIDETPEQRGAAVLLSRLMSSGTDTLSPEEMSQRWAMLGVDTARDPYVFAGPQDIIISFRYPEGAEERPTFIAMADVVEAVLGNLTLSPERVEAARNDLLEQTGESAPLTGENLLLSRLRPDAPFAVRASVDDREALRRLSRDDLVAYYREWFRPDNAMLIGVGTFRPGMLLSQVDTRIMRGPEPVGDPPARTPAIPPYQPGGDVRVVVIPESGRDIAEVSVVSLVEPVAPLRIYADLYEDIRRERALAIFGARLAGREDSSAVPWDRVGASTDDLYMSSRFTRVRATGEPDNWRPMLRRLITEIRRAQLHGFAPEEKREDLGPRLNARLVERQSAYEDLTQAQRLNQLLEFYRDDSIPMSSEELQEIRFKLMRLTSLEELNEAFASTLDLSRAAVVVRVPADAKAPDPSEINAIAEAAIASTPDPLRPDEATPELLEQRPEGGGITEIEFDAESGVWSAWLDNGIRVHHRPMPDAEGVFDAHISFAGGQIEETEDTRGLTDAATLAWNEQRTGRFTPQEFDSIIVGSRLIVDMKRTTDTVGLLARGDASNAEMGFQALHLMLNDWELDPTFLTEWRDFVAGAAGGYNNTPEGVINVIWPRALFGTSVEHLDIITAEQVNDITHDEAVAWLQRIIDTAPAEIGIAGDLQYERAFELASTYFGGLPERPRIDDQTLAERRRVPRPQDDERVVSETHVSPATDVSAILEGFVGADAEQARDVRRLQLAALSLGRGPIAELREAMDLPRPPAVFSRESTIYPGFGIFATITRTPYEAREQVTRRVREIYREFARGGPEPGRFGELRDEIASQAEEAALDTSWWAAHLALSDYRGRGYAKPIRDAEAYRNITGEQVRQTFARYLNTNARIHAFTDPETPGERERRVGGGEGPAIVPRGGGGDDG